MRGTEGRARRWLAAGGLAVVLALPAGAEAPRYAEVVAGYRQADYLTDADVVVRIEAEQIARQGGGTAVLETVEGVRTASWEREGHWIEWTFTVPRRGLYTIEARYRVPEVVPTDTWYLSRSITIDGQVPFREMQEFGFADAWCISREERDYRIKAYNEYGEKPDVALRAAEPVKAWQTALLTDRETAFVEPYLFLLAAGAHRLRMEAVTRPVMQVDAFTVRSYRPLRPYTEVAAEYQRKGYTTTSGVNVRIQAEGYRYQERNGAVGIGLFTDAAILLMRNNGDPQGDYNTLATWKRFNHSVFWTFEVPETGLYQMVIRYTQDQDSEMFREIRIDGKVPFRELSPYVMKGTGGRNNTPPTLLLSDASIIQGEGTYDVVKWKQGVVGREVPKGRKGATEIEPYLFYLEKGTHVLQMRPVLGAEKVQIKKDIEAVRNAVSGPFQQVKELLGQYESLEEAVKAKLDLRAELPNLSDAYTRAADDLTGIMKEILAQTPAEQMDDIGPTISVLKIIQQELVSVGHNPNMLLAAEQFDSGFTTGAQSSTQSSGNRSTSMTAELTLGTQGNFESRIINRLSYTAGLYDYQPVEIDWIAFTSPDVKIPEPVAPWFFTIQWMWKEFLRSFTQ